MTNLEAIDESSSQNEDSGSSAAIKTSRSSVADSFGNLTIKSDSVLNDAFNVKTSETPKAGERSFTMKTKSPDNVSEQKFGR